MDAVVSRLHQALAEALKTRKGGREGQPVSVAEIYQELVPYRNVRSAIGVEMNADYEYALLRLLAGEGNFARIEPVEAREALRLEIGSPNPNVTLYRKYAGCDVWVDLDRPGAPLLTGPDTPDAAEAALPVTLSELAITRLHAPPIRPPSSAFSFSEIEEAGHARTSGHAGTPGARAGHDVTTVSESDPLDDVNFTARPDGEHADDGFDDLEIVTDPSCIRCNGRLPVGRTVNFCPHCGADQRLPACSACGELIENGWRYCPACGATVADRADGSA
jgi:predicted RNA-binding Zn-ribbon protein involved in translation (DUF1610 family)